MAAKKPKTFTHAALQAFANAWLGKGNTPTQQMLDQGFVKAVQSPNAPAKPFLTGEQQLGQSDTQRDHDIQVQDLQNHLAQAVANSKESRYNIERGRVRGVAGTQDNAAARGIFQSSIKDGQIFDINAQAAHQQQQVTDQLSALQTSVASRINLLDEALRRSQASFNQMVVDNASQIDTGYATSYKPANSSSPATKPAAGAAKAVAQVPAWHLRYTGGFGRAPGYRNG